MTAMSTMPPSHSSQSLMPSKPFEVSRFLRLWTLATLLCASAVLILGALITTFRVGMSDPVWPTEPWFLVVNHQVWVEEPARGFLIEHTHRLVAWGIGVFATVLAIAAWRTNPAGGLRLAGTIAIVAVLVSYLGLHGDMGAAWRARKAGGALVWPVNSLIALGLSFAGLLLVLVLAARRGAAGSGFRMLGVLVLFAVMIQGLLGGYRVYLDQLMGTQLAAIHGSFGQMTFALLAALTAWSLGSWRLPDSLPGSESSSLRVARQLAWVLLLAVIIQLIWGVWLRHLGAGVAQRLHLFTAFAVFAVGLLLSLQILRLPALRSGLSLSAWALLVIFGLQIYLGIEAYLGKFAVSGPEAALPVDLRPIHWESAAIRTSHTLLGAALLGFVSYLLTRLHTLQTEAPSISEESDGLAWSESASAERVGQKSESRLVSA